MKTKNNVLAIVEIAIVLCSLFLVATLPAIASGQKAITTVSEDDYVLGVYGNANEDDTIDMRDLTYVKLIFFGKKPETELADAKYDGKINPLDFIQIKLIIVGKEKELTIVDSKDRIVTVKKPVKRIVLLNRFTADVIHILKAQDKVVGVNSDITKDEIYFPELSKLPSVGKHNVPDLEVILSLNTDLAITGPSYVARITDKLPGITVLGFNFYKAETFTEELVKIGYILDKKDEARYYIDEFSDKYIDLVKARTEGLSEEERPKVCVAAATKENYYVYFGGSGAHQLIDTSGGRNLFADLPYTGAYVDPEEVVMRNPDIFIKHQSPSKGHEIGYGTDNPSEMKAVWEKIMNRPELANVTAVKTERVYIFNNDLSYGSDYPIAVAYWAKWFHPNLFEDLDPKAIHQEFLTEFHGLDYDLDKHGVFVYPEPS